MEEEQTPRASPSAPDWLEEADRERLEQELKDKNAEIQRLKEELQNAGRGAKQVNIWRKDRIPAERLIVGNGKRSFSFQMLSSEACGARGRVTERSSHAAGTRVDMTCSSGLEEPSLFSPSITIGLWLLLSSCCRNGAE